MGRRIGFLCFCLWMLSGNGIRDSVAYQNNHHSGWRFFTTADGFYESWTYSVTLGPTGRLCVLHGDVDFMSLYDGYSVERVPSPGQDCTVRESDQGRLWANAWDPQKKLNQGMLRYSGSRWERLAIPEILSYREPLDDRFLPVADENILLLLPTCLWLYDSSTRQIKPIQESAEGRIGEFLEIVPSSDGSAWIAGEAGAARLRPRNGRSFADSEWTPYPLSPDTNHHRLQFLTATNAGDVFAVAQQKPTEETILLKFNGSSWETAYRSPESPLIMGWPDFDGGLWIITGDRNSYDIFRLNGDQMQPVEKQKVFSGHLFRVAVEPNGVFWVATSTGLARYAPPLWSTPVPLLDQSELFDTIEEDDQGRLYFANQDSLIVRDQDQWDSHPFPREWSPAGNFTSQGLAPLPDGRMAVGSSFPDLLIFDPATNQFDSLKHPDGKAVRLFAGRKGHGLWLMTRNEKDESFLETYDGTSFQPFGGPDPEWNQGLPRYLLERENGDVWLAGLGRSGLGMIRNGAYRPIASEDGYDGTGAISLLDTGNGTVWVGERDRIVETDGTSWKVIRNNLETVRAMIRARDGSIWIACGIGVYRYFDNTWILYDVQDNLMDAAVYDVFEDSRNQIRIATSQGINVYNRAADPDAPETVIHPDNVREVSPDGKARVLFSGIDKWKYTDAGRLLFSHRVDDQPWSEFLPDPDVLLDGLRYGRHRFEVRAIDRSWNIDPTPAQFVFDVLKPWYLQTGFLVILSSGSSVIVLLIGYALSRHFRLEYLVVQRTRELLHSNESLQTEMQERQRSEKARLRLQEQLYQSRKLEGIGRLAGGIAHDFNNILTAILGYSDLLLLRLKDNSRVEKDLEEIKKSALRAASLTQQLLAFSRKQMMQPRVFNLNTLIQDTENILRRLISEDIEFVIRLESELPNIQADPTQIEQIVMNLCINARDAMPNGGQLFIETADATVDSESAGRDRETPPGRYVLLSVSDTGCGIDPENLPHIFEPFFTTKENGKGTGLGLSTVYGIVKQSGGSIWVYSEPNHGTTFKVFFPVCLQEAEKPLRPPRPNENEKGTGTVLLVEDEASVRSLAHRILQEAGFAVIPAQDGVEALERCKDHPGPIDLVLTDIIMPRMGGKELVERMTLLHPRIKALYVSGYTGNVLVEQGILEGNIQFLMKPFAPPALIRKVKEVLAMT